MASKMNTDAWSRINAVADAMDVSLTTLCERMQMSGQAQTNWRRQGMAPEVVALAAEMLLVRDRAMRSDDPVIAKSALRLPARKVRAPVLSAAEKRRRAAATGALVRSIREQIGRGEAIAAVAHRHAVSEQRVRRIAETVGGR